MKHLILTVLVLLISQMGYAQTLTEKLLRQSPKLSYNISLDYESNLQKSDTYQNAQSTSVRISPRYRINDTYTLLGFAGFTQSLTQENRSDLNNTVIAISRKPTPIAGIMDVRPTLSVTLATNELQRNKDSLRGAIQLSTSGFFRTNSSLIAGLGARFRLNNHRYSVSAIRGANIKTMITPSAIVGWSFGKFQLVTSNAYSYGTTYRGTRRGNFSLDQSLTYIPTAKMNFSIGHNNRGSVLSRDGRSSNVDVFNSKTSVFYVSALYNY